MGNLFRLLLWVGLLACAGCANITAPTGGRRDVTPPKLVHISPADSLLNTRVTRITLDFNEYITVSDVGKEVSLSPMLAIQPTVIGLNKRVTVKIIDSLLEENTTYRLSFGNAIKDLHEGNPFSKYTYMFSTGAYFDSMQLQGTIINAATGLPDSSGAMVELYAGYEIDSAVIRHAPRYVVKAEGSHFSFKGLPKRSFRIYAIKDASGNYIYDGPEANEMIAFCDTNVTPGDSATVPITLKLFTEIPDTTSDTTLVRKPKVKTSTRMGGGSRQRAEDGLSYTVNVDTSDAEKRTFDVTGKLGVSFSKRPVLNTAKISLAYDREGEREEVPVTLVLDSLPTHVLHIVPDEPWRENTVYTLRLAKGFARDTGDADVMPARFTFRTLEDQDYGKIKLHIPGKYRQFHAAGRGKADTQIARYVLRINAGVDSAYQAPITDTVVVLNRLKPATYTFRIIVDENGNGLWDTGDLFGCRQPEDVIPFPEAMVLKAGWESIIDLEQKKPEPKKPAKEKPAKPK